MDPRAIGVPDMRPMRHAPTRAALILALSTAGPASRAADFVRGDVDTDGHVDARDAVRALGHLFLERSPPACAKALDTNDDGRLDVSDPIHLLAHLFLDHSLHPPPPPPYPSCGTDPTPDALSCESPPCDARALVPPTTKVLDDRTLDRLGEVAADGTLYFPARTPLLDALRPGDVLAAAASEMLPGGLLRRVRSAAYVGGRFIVETDAATLSDAVERGRIRATLDLSAATITRVARHVAGAEIVDFAPAEAAEFGVDACTSLPDPRPVHLSLRDIPLGVGGDGGSLAGAALDADAHFDARAVIDVAIDALAPNRLICSFATRRAETLDLRGHAPAKLDHLLDVVTIDFAATTVWLGPLPVVIRPRLRIRIGIRGHVDDGLDVRLARTSCAAYELGLEEDVPASEGRASGAASVESARSARPVSAELCWETTVELRVLGTAGPSAVESGFLDLNREDGDGDGILCTPREIAAGVRGSVGAGSLAEYAALVFDAPVTVDAPPCAAGAAE